MPQSRHKIALVVALAVLTLAVLAVPVTALAATPGSGLWYWPTGTEDFKGRSGWWDYRSSNRSWHMAQDMPAPVGHPVYAVGDGVVLESKPASGYGGVLIVLHRNADGSQFKAVYGHIRRGPFPKGARVRAGQNIGRVNGFGHLHFGIHPGRAYPPDGNPYRGHTYNSAVTYGWVDPIAYLKTHPRVKITPPLPVVATVETSLTPNVLGTADGVVFWSVETSGGEQTVYSRPIGGTQTLALDTPLPSLDTSRFAVQVASDRFTLRDRLPALTAAYSALTPVWGKALALKGTLRSADGSPFVGATVSLERSIDATSWTRVGSALSGMTGAWTISYKPTRACRLRLRFSASDPFISTATSEKAVAPHAGLRAPDKPSTAARGVPFEVSGKLFPRHAAGSQTVMLRFQRRTRSGAWVEALTAPATNRDAGTATRYSGRVTLAAGPWRVRAETAADQLHAAATTGWFRIAVQ
jgi:hypothetical protein